MLEKFIFVKINPAAAPAGGRLMCKIVYEDNHLLVLRMVDKDATPKTKALYANLWLIHERGAMFGHHDFPSYGIGWRGDKGRSDVKDVVGDHPAVYSLDMHGINERKIEFV